LRGNKKKIDGEKKANTSLDKNDISGDCHKCRVGTKGTFWEYCKLKNKMMSFQNND